jgi:hypothetical protein
MNKQDEATTAPKGRGTTPDDIALGTRVLLQLKQMPIPLHMLQSRSKGMSKPFHVDDVIASVRD